MEKTATKLAKARDRYAKNDVLREAVGYSEQLPFFIEMVRQGYIDIASDPELWTKYTEQPRLLETDEVIDLIKNGKGEQDGYMPVLPGWPSSFEKASNADLSPRPGGISGGDDRPDAVATCRVFARPEYRE